MHASASTYLMGYVGAALFVLGATTAGFILLTDTGSLPRKYWQQYESALEAEVRFQLWKTTGAYIARVQAAVVLALFITCVFMGEPLLWLTMPVAIFGPWFHIQREHAKRIEQLEILLDSWLLLLANALKASPSLGESISNSAKLIRPPFSEEVDLVIKEMKLGTPLDAAILNMSARLNSRVVSSSLATILVGRQTGGDLPAILEQSASTLREMQRLEGVVRTKTAEGRMQAFVLGAIPFVLLAVLHQMDPTYLVPLFETTTGNVVLIIAVMLWFSAIIMARRILTVDI
ncbi:MAG: type II secretion system F family protein [Sandaracinaceae bacterium]|jgi:tight adherence protein B|nr:type II secretion system F family protein [Sandaracinaceae bacterium]